MSLAKRIAHAFGKARSGANGYICRCPCHEDPNGSLMVSDIAAANGKIPIQFWCPAGCSDEDIFFIAKKLDLIRELTPEEKKIEKMSPMLAEYWFDEPEVQVTPIVEGLFDAGDKVVIIGQSKTRKSFFTQQLSFCLASGRKFLDFNAMPKRKVLLIQFEIRPERYHLRCKRMIGKLALESHQLEGLLIINARGYDGDLFRLIETMVKRYSPDVIVLDPLYKLIVGDEAKSEDIKPVLRFFDTLAESSKAAVVYVHHDKKGHAGDQQLTDRGSGSGVLARDFDSAIFLSPQKDDENTLVVEFIARNYPPLKKLAIDWIEGHFSLSNASTEKRTARNSINKKAKNSELVVRAKEFIKIELGFGRKTFPMSVFNGKLEDIGIQFRAIPGIKAQLIEDGFIEVATQKAEKGQSSKVVNLVSVAPEPIEASSEFMQSFDDEHEERF